jgi:hypothetical protein
MRFPFHHYFRETSYYQEVCCYLEDFLRLTPAEDLPRTGPFAGAKRYLHAAAPSLWEESERMEAEVRMAGALFLAALYSTLLHIYTGACAWAVCSGVAFTLLGVGFNRLRIREVGYTYLNLLIAANLARRESAASPT